MAARGRIERTVVLLSGLALALILFGFFLFAAHATRLAREPIEKADGIVILTGEASRIQAGARLLAAGRGKRMLISGVNRKTSSEDVRRLTGLDKVLFTCCVDIGYEAMDTVGNAEETRRWAMQWGYRSLIVVTAAYHMPRSLAEMRDAMPNVVLTPYSVPGRGLGDGAPWWLNGGASRILLEEYAKLLVAAPRLAARYLVRS